MCSSLVYVCNSLVHMCLCTNHLQTSAQIMRIKLLNDTVCALWHAHVIMTSSCTLMTCICSQRVYKCTHLTCMPQVLMSSKVSKVQIAKHKLELKSVISNGMLVSLQKRKKQTCSYYKNCAGRLQMN